MRVHDVAACSDDVFVVDHDAYDVHRFISGRLNVKKVYLYIRGDIISRHNEGVFY